MGEFTELGLSRLQESPAHPAESTPTVVPADLAEVLTRTLDIMSRVAPEADAVERDELAAGIAGFRQRLAASDHEADLRGLAAAVLASWERFLWSSRAFYAAKDREVGELIAILRAAVESALGASERFNAEVLSSADRFRKLSQLEDIRELRQQLSAEVSTLQQAAEEKHRMDAEAMAQLSRRVAELETNLVEAEHEAAVDPLTGIPNRRSFDRFLTESVKASDKSGEPLTLALLDVDDFKDVNDEYGHQAGDMVLRQSAAILASAVRRDDLVARYGGEEFALVLRGSDMANAERRLSQLLKSIAATDLAYDDSTPPKTLRCTFSAGVAQLSATDTVADLLERADEALYEAKQRGRNRVMAKRRSRLFG